MKEYVIANGIKGAYQKEFYRKVAKIKEGLSTLMELLQRNLEDQCFGWELDKRKVQWHGMFCSKGKDNSHCLG